MTDATPAPFGAFALPPAMERLRALRDLLPWRAWSSTIRRIVLAGRGDPVDIRVEGEVRARLYPHENRTDRRAVAQFRRWDLEERMAIDVVLAAAGSTAYFLDVGANSGLYALWCADRARRRGADLRVLAIECDPVSLPRLRFNIAASGLPGIALAETAVGAAPGRL
ncbi:MAG: hypothetical protein AAFW69_11800, partial [Pseudomonadota bacterium]